MKYKGPERRKYKRIKRSFTARVRLYQKDKKSDESSKWNIVTIKDLGAGGLCFNHSQKIALGTELEFNIALPFTKEPIHCIGEVCRIDESHLGKISTPKIPIYWIAVRFTEIDADKKEAIINYAKDF